MSAIVRSAEESAGRRRDVLRVLRAASVPMSITSIAAELHLHPNTVRFHLGTLLSDGRVEHVEADRKRPGRPPLMFRAIREMDPSGPRDYRLLAEILAMSLAAGRNSHAKALAAGRAWGQRLESPTRHGKRIGAHESIDHLLGVLDELGFAPERRESGGVSQVGLRHCPFLELAKTRTTVVCPIHLGLMQGALASWKAPVAVDRLEAFVEPDLCLAHLTLVTAR
ncbi:transcriptional regulator [Mycobacterium haemophilum DSM 44634]|uniref:helix-turn-helix transcriptional regulator n=1 Tax=Mycobacterium haemophilum TaxID=29311 RepID=UPI000656528E|nr:helix-turn-helix domain-containing protein [Mycobacterium haemophilum]AKN17820.1 transcriptional regulator [Mycobacterium haemophilum DSM 44634]MCV7340755.1 transcriptional regulator [Mycobacterium haemophilum DSM 44634]